MKRRAEENGKWTKRIPWWLKRLDLVRAELRTLPFPRTPQEGLKQCAELSALSMELFKDEIRKTLRTTDENRVELETLRLTARLSKVDERWKLFSREKRVKPERK